LSNDVVSVLVFSGIFGISLAVSERRTGNSFFPELKHLHDACLLIFEWLNILVPVGIISLIAPQVAELGSDVFLILARFLLLVVAGIFILIAFAILIMAVKIRVSVRHTFAVMLKPLSLVAATRNATACVPIAVDAMTNELHVSRAGCELFIPLGVHGIPIRLYSPLRRCHDFHWCACWA
jgi:Na+/H+-dicarboxylate symporter